MTAVPTAIGLIAGDCPRLEPDPVDSTVSLFVKN